MPDSIWGVLSDTFSQGDDGQRISVRETFGSSEPRLYAPRGFPSGGRSGFNPTPVAPNPKQIPLNLQPKSTPASSGGAVPVRIKGGEFGGLQEGLTRQTPLPSSLSPLPDLRGISPRGVGADPIGKNLPSRRGSSEPLSGIKDLADKLRGGSTKPGRSSGAPATPGSAQPKTAPSPQKLPFKEPAPAPKGLLGLKPSPRPANQPKTGTPSPKNSLPAQRRDPRTAKPFPGKPENQPLGDRPSRPRNKSPYVPTPIGQTPIDDARIAFGLYKFEVTFERTNPLNDPRIGPDYQIVVEADATGPIYSVRQNDNPPTTLQYIEYDNGVQWQVAGLNTALSRFGGVKWIAVGYSGFRCVANCDGPFSPRRRGSPNLTPPLVNPTPSNPRQLNPTPNRPLPSATPVPGNLPFPFPLPQINPSPKPAPTQKPQQQPKPDANKEPQRSPSAQRNPATKPKPSPAPQPAPSPTASGSGSFPRPATSGTPEGSGNTKPGSDFKPNTDATPPSPAPTPNYPEPSSPKIQPLPSPTPIPSTGQTPNYNPIEDKNPDPKTKEPVPVVQFPPFPVAPKLNSGNACKTADPCTQQISSGVDSANEKATDIGKQVKDITDALDKALQVADFSLLVLINDKMGPKVEGGLSSQGNRILKLVANVQSTAGAIQEKLGKFAKWARLGQLVSVLTLITTLHNALMLSRSVGETLLSMLSNGLAVFGIKDDGGNPYELGELIGKSVEAAMKETIGTENYTTLSTNFKKANRIYQAAANLGNSIQSLRFSVVSALETIGGWNARIGNALRRSGVVNESSYAWMNPSPNFDNKFTRALERVEDTVSQVDSVASEVLSAQETVTQIGNQKTELANSLGLGTEKPQTEHQPGKTAATATKAASAAPNIEATDLIKPGV
jgi:hypothetical protein